MAQWPDGTMAQSISLSGSMTESTDQMLQKRVELILQQLDGVGTLPDAASVIAVTPASNASAVESALKRLEGDAGLSERALKLVGAIISDSMTSVDGARKRVGFEALRHAVIAVGAYEVFTSAKPQE